MPHTPRPQKERGGEEVYLMVEERERTLRDVFAAGSEAASVTLESPTPGRAAHDVTCTPVLRPARGAAGF
jgi:hypothetical protein